MGRLGSKDVCHRRRGVPSFWLGIMIIVGLLITSQHFSVNPGCHRSTTCLYGKIPRVQPACQLLLPAIATGYRSSAVITRMTRSAMLEVLREDYIRTGRAKGQRSNSVVLPRRSASPRSGWVMRAANNDGHSRWGTLSLILCRHQGANSSYDTRPRATRAV